MPKRSLPDLGPRGEGWFVAQLVLLAAVVLAGFLGPAWSGWMRTAGVALGAALLGLGGLLAFRGVVDLGEHLTPFPRPPQGGRLVDSGAYRLVRHPIYGGLILGAFGWALVMASPLGLAASAVLAVFFALKASREEAWLTERFEDYRAYQARTRGFIPWIYLVADSGGC
jgi:protein-S-isoprenylcysteine O-methyltransferase Ste14